MPSSTAAMTTAMTTAVSTRPGDDGRGRDRRRAPPLQHAAFALRGHRDDQVAEARRDDAEGDDAGHVVHRGADPAAGDLDGVAAAAEHRGEDHQEQHRQGQGEELRLAVAEKGAQVVAGLVQGHADHRWSFVLVEPVRER